MYGLGLKGVKNKNDEDEDEAVVAWRGVAWRGVAWRGVEGVFSLYIAKKSCVLMCECACTTM